MPAFKERRILQVKDRINLQEPKLSCDFSLQQVVSGNRGNVGDFGDAFSEGPLEGDGVVSSSDSWLSSEGVQDQFGAPATH